MTEVSEDCGDFESVSVEGTRFRMQMMKIIRTFEMPRKVHRTSQGNISQDSNLQELPVVTKFDGPL